MSRLRCARCGALIIPGIARDGMCGQCNEQVAAAAAAAEEAEAEPRASLSLEQYLALLDGVPIPTQKQRENFVDYVSHAHSWYKHLPLYPPGKPFHFFLDKYAGCDRMVGRDGRAAMVERSEQGFHYSAIPTQEYRSRLGYLAYSCNAGTTVVLTGVGPLVVPRDKLAAVPRNDAVLGRLPEEIVQAGVVRVTGVIHACSFGMNLWVVRGRTTPDRIIWPEESGGKRTVERIFERSLQIADPNYDIAAAMKFARSHPELAEHTISADPVLYELLEPERRRQQAEMLKAIERVCELVESHRKALP